MLLFLDGDFAPVFMTEEYRDFRFTRRFDRPGDFSVVLPVTDAEKLGGAVYLYRPKDGQVGIVRGTSLKKSEKGRTLTVFGRTAEILLFERVIASPVTLDGDLEEEILTLVQDTAMSGTRAIPSLLSTESTGAAGTVCTQAFGVTLGQFLYDTLLPLGCSPRMRFNGEDGFVFSILTGIDRTEGDGEVVFSGELENLETLSFERDDGEKVNFAYVAGAMEDGERTVAAVNGMRDGEARREIWVSAYDLRREDGMSEAKYLSLLEARGREALHVRRTGAETVGGRGGARRHAPRQEYGLGDTVKVIESGCGISASLRILGITEYGTEEDAGEELVFGSVPPAV